MLWVSTTTGRKDTRDEDVMSEELYWFEEVPEERRYWFLAPYEAFASQAAKREDTEFPSRTGAPSIGGGVQLV